jgi:asparagine synthetase B (glutamine-hydrolysing)
MCGICGDLRFDGSEASAEAISAMMRVIAPRGPDAGGMLVRNGTGGFRLRPRPASRHARIEPSR